MEDENSYSSKTITSASSSDSSKTSASLLYEESDAEENYERDKILNAEINKRLLEMGLTPNSLKRHKRNFYYEI